MIIKVRSGDSLLYYSEVFDLPLQLILNSNRDIKPEELYVGQEVQIPGYITNNYTIKSGDSLYNLAQKNNVSLDTLYLLNQNIDPEQLSTGQTINLPARKKDPVVNPEQYYDYDVMMKDIRALLNIYPFLKYNIIGKTVLNRPIPEIRIGEGAKNLHEDASFHANEWITTPVLMYFLNNYALAVSNKTKIRGVDVTQLYKETNLSIVPMVNPDGVNLVIDGPPAEETYRSLVIKINNGSTDFSDWKANIKGVDLNLQFPANWEFEKKRGPSGPAPRDYAGPHPLSEPESIAMAKLTENSDFLRVIAFHTQGQVIYYGFENLEPPRSAVIAQEFARVSGYTPVENAYSYAGYKDWFIQDWRRPGFTIEIGKGDNPLPISQVYQIYNNVLGIFLANLYL